MAIYKNTQATKVKLDKVPGVRGNRWYICEGSGAVDHTGKPLNLVEIPDEHLGLPGVKWALDNKILVPFDGKMPAPKPVTPPPAAPKPADPPPPDLTAGITGAPMVPPEPAPAAAAAETEATEEDAGRRRRRRTQEN